MLELAPEDDAVPAERAAPVAKELPGDPEELGVLGAEGEEARGLPFEEVAQELAVVAAVEELVVEALAPVVERPLDPGGAHEGASVGELEEFFEVPAEVGEVFLGEEGVEGAGRAGLSAVGGDELKREAGLGAGEEDAELVHDGDAWAAILPGREAGGRHGGG